ncbi:MAG: diguanylate cyclase [Pseudomonadota bacterium]
METVLIVEDSKVFLSIIQKQITLEFGFECVSAGSLKEAGHVLETRADQFLLAVLDLNLPDAPKGEIVDYVVSKGVPVIVVTALINDDIRDQIMSSDIFDYIIKEGPHSMVQLTDTIRRFVRNKHITILAVDDSGVGRKIIRKSLEKQMFSVIEAANGQEALAQLKVNPNIRLVITDYHMPVMDGFHLTGEIRKQFPLGEIGIIGVSAVGNPILSAQFLKTGANDFVNKPYNEEEFQWRIHQNIELLESMRIIRESATKDYLTGLYNRRYFFNAAEKLFENAKRKNLHILIGMIDIDNFKAINDTYGHGAGDQVIQNVAQILRNSFRASDIVARYGGEEFVVLGVNMLQEKHLIHFEDLRKAVETSSVKTLVGEIKVTVSIGVTTRIAASLDDMVNESDNQLYNAKKAGRNKVIADA